MTTQTQLPPCSSANWGQASTWHDCIHTSQPHLHLTAADLSSSTGCMHRPVQQIRYNSGCFLYPCAKAGLIAVLACGDGYAGVQAEASGGGAHTGMSVISCSDVLSLNVYDAAFARSGLQTSSQHWHGCLVLQQATSYSPTCNFCRSASKRCSAVCIILCCAVTTASVCLQA